MAHRPVHRPLTASLILTLVLAVPVFGAGTSSHAQQSRVRQPHSLLTQASELGVELWSSLSQWWTTWADDASDAPSLEAAPPVSLDELTIEGCIIDPNGLRYCPQ